jgi:ribokinase
VIPAIAVTAVDPTGAGDAFIGSLAVFWAEGLSLPEAARRANVVAALTVTRRGAQAAFPSRAESESFLDHRG